MIHRSVALVVACALFVLTACDDKPKCRSGTCVEDAGSDGGMTTPNDGGLDGGHDSGVDAGHDAGPVVECSNLPPGLYVAGSCSVLAANVFRFEPNFILWSDGATKDRFYSLPAGTQIDASNPDYWVFPVGTIFWKHFSVGAGASAVRVETRMMKKTSAGTGTGAWEMRTFVWNSTQDEVTEVVNGMQNALGTSHDIPNAPEDCIQCHNTLDVALGFSALQIRNALGDTEGRLSYLLATNRILLPTDPNFDTAQEFSDASQLPTAATATERAALGYLHANCGNCHGNYGTAMGPTMRLFMPIGNDDAAVVTTPPYLTTVGVTSSFMSLKRVEPHTPTSSAIRVRMASRTIGTQMPPLATETPDTFGGIAAVDAWINSLP